MPKKGTKKVRLGRGVVRFQRFQSSWLHCLWAVVRQNITVEGDGGAKMLTSWQPENREKEREGARHKITSRIYPSDPVTQFFQKVPTS